MSALVERRSALPSVERARALLSEARTSQEVRKIRAVAQAVATLERGKEIAIDAGEIVLLADARIGELRQDAKEIPRPGPGRGKKNQPRSQGLVSVKAAFDADAGLSKNAGAEAEKIADLAKAGDLDRYTKACRKAGHAPTTSGAITLARLSEEDRATAFANLGDIPDVRKAVRETKRRARTAKLVEIARADAPLPSDRRYPIVLADPPWRYEHVETESRAIENQYPTMDLEAICAMPLGKITTDDAVLFLWVTSPKLEEGMRVVSGWGFTYRTCMVWDKEKIGMGYYARQQHELLLICTKGSPPTPSEKDRPASVVRAPRGKHSSKPTVFYELIERMYPTLPKIELFCRSPRDGWAAWGNQSGVAA